MMRFCFALTGAAFLFAFSFTSVHAQTCGSNYTVTAGDSLSKISRDAYSNPTRWSLIYYANQSTIGGDPSLIHPGQQLRIPCTNSAETATAPEPAKSDAITTASTSRTTVASANSISLLTADDYRPFTDRALPKGGMITDIIRSALELQAQSADAPAFDITWVNDWSAHLNPLLAKQAFDLGFPWFQPDCDRYDDLDDPARYRCDTFHFSEPVFEILVLFFTRKDSGFQFTSDDQVAGKRLCRPSGYFTFDLDKDGRNWVKEEKVTLLRPQNVDECFQMLARNEVDAVAINEFTGRAAVSKLNMDNDVTVIEKPVSVLNLHVIVAKAHPRAPALLGHVNEALKQIKSSGKYGEIIEHHLSAFWSAQDSS